MKITTATEESKDRLINLFEEQLCLYHTSSTFYTNRMHAQNDLCHITQRLHTLFRFSFLSEMQRESCCYGNNIPSRLVAAVQSGCGTSQVRSLQAVTSFNSSCRESLVRPGRHYSVLGFFELPAEGKGKIFLPPAAEFELINKLCRLFHQHTNM